jgi:hypothetical protein
VVQFWEKKSDGGDNEQIFYPEQINCCSLGKNSTIAFGQHGLFSETQSFYKDSYLDIKDFSGL